jgi:hypothetical protein
MCAEQKQDPVSGDNSGTGAKKYRQLMTGLQSRLVEAD